MRCVLVGSLGIIAACSSPEPRQTTGFALNDHAISKIATICHTSDRVAVAQNNGNPRESQSFWREWCELALDTDTQKVWGDVVIELQGNRSGGTEVCGLHIGPAMVSMPVPPTLVEKFIDDPALQQQIDAKLAPIDASREYEYQERVAGFQLDVVQRYMRTPKEHNIVIDLRMDGCDQLPDASPARFKQGFSLIKH